MLSTRGGPQILAPQLQDPGADLNLVSQLHHRVVSGVAFETDSFIQEADAYSAHPADLVGHHHHALGMDLGKGKGKAWFFCSPYHETTGGRRRKRKVGAGNTYWHPEAGEVEILDPDKKLVVAHKRTLSYVSKVNNPPGAPKPFRLKRLGWSMVEIWLKQKQHDPDGVDRQLVLCKVYRPSRASRDAEVSPEAGKVHGGDKPCPAPAPAPSPNSQVTECKKISGYNLQSPEVTQKPPLSIRPAALKHSARCGPKGGEIPPSRSRSGVAIVKKAPMASAPVTVVMKFGGSLTRSADRMKEMAKLVCSFPDGSEESPVVVLSAMGNTTANLLRAAVKAMRCGRYQEATEIHELALTKEQHFRMIEDLGLDRSIASGSLDELEDVFKAIAIIKELTPTTQEYLVSFGEQMSTSIFLAYLNKLGKRPRQEWESCAIDTCGRGGTDLTMTTIARELGSREIQVWKDVNGLLTCDPNVCANAIPLSFLTFDEVVELGLFGAHSTQLAMEGGIPVIVKNLCNPQAPGTVISKIKDISKSISSIVWRSNITVLNIESVDQSDFTAKSLSTFRKLGLSVDCVAISNAKISLIVVPSKLSIHELFQLEVDNAVEELQKFAVIHRVQHRSVITLIGNDAQMSSIVFAKAVNVLQTIDVDVQKFSHGPSEVMKVSLVVHDNEAKHCVQALHSVFFEKGFASKVQGADRELNGFPVQVPEKSSAVAASSGDKRKAHSEHPEAPQGMRQERMDTDPDGRPEDTEYYLSPEIDPMAVGGDNVGHPDGNGRDSRFQDQYDVGKFLHMQNGVDQHLQDPTGSGEYRTQQVESEEQQGLAGMAEGSSGSVHSIKEMEDSLFSDECPMPSRGYDGGGAGGYWAGVRDGAEILADGGGEQAMPQSAPSAATETEAGQGLWTNIMSTQALPEPDELFQMQEWDPVNNDLFAMVSNVVRPLRRDS